MCSPRKAVKASRCKPRTPCRQPKRNCCPTRVTFRKHRNTRYGYDDKTDPRMPYKSVKAGGFDFVVVKVVPKGRKVRFISSNPAVAKVQDAVPYEPAWLGPGGMLLSISGGKRGEAQIRAVCGGCVLATLQVKTYVLRTKTVAVRLVHEKGWKSTDLDLAKLQRNLDAIYAQAVVQIKLTRLPAMTVAFDRNRNKKFDVALRTTCEMKKVRDKAKDTRFDGNVFLVDPFSNRKWSGLAGFCQRYMYVDVPGSNGAFGTAVVVAHEIGHALFGLHHYNKHPKGNAATNNLMHETGGHYLGDHLVKRQWDKINPR